MGRGNRLEPWRLSDLWGVGLIVGILGLAVLPSQTFASTQVMGASQVNCVPDIALEATVHLGIQAATARKGDEQILICPGRYTEPVTIDDPVAHIDFMGVGDKSEIVIQAHAGSAGPIYQVLRADYIRLSNLTVDGQSKHLSSNTQF